nr:MAG TPA: hypothetical protein [Caudoviricetes sp.]DAK87631.1 MAG TPA: hypothetical protein [Bacteriophage sp.]
MSVNVIILVSSIPTISFVYCLNVPTIQFNLYGQGIQGFCIYYETYIIVNKIHGSFAVEVDMV